MGNEVSTSTWSSTYNEIKSKHDEAYVAIQSAITLEEEDKPQEALEKYKQGIQLIDEALRVQVTCPENPDFTWEKVVVMIQKIKKTRAEVLTRINWIQEISEPVEICEREHPPSYEEAMASTPTTPSTPQTYDDLARALNQITVDTKTPMDAEVVFMYEGVQFYFISPTGEVSSTLRPQTLKIILVEDEGKNVPRAVLQIGDWVYPLIPGVSPCYRADYGAFIMPNVYAETPGSSIGIILPPDADADAYDVLESILYGIVGESKPPEKILPGEELSEKISSGIVSSASFLSRGLVTGAEKLGNFFNTSTPKLMTRINSAERPTEISPRVSKGMQIAETATNKAAQVTGYVAEQVGVATVKLGHFLAPHIQKHGTRLLTSGFRMSEADASAKVKGVMTVAAGAVEGFSTVYHGLETSASILGQSLKNNSVKIIQHKYGQPAGEFAGDTFSTVGNVFQINRNTKIIQPKHFAKKAAKEAGKAFVYKYKNKCDDGAGSSHDIADPSSSTQLSPLKGDSQDILPEKK